MTRRVRLEVGATILTNRGRVLVSALQPQGVMVSSGDGDQAYLSYSELEVRDAGAIDAVHVSLYPWWDGLTKETQTESLWRQEVVLEILTGYRSGTPLLPAEGEPFYPFGRGSGVSEAKRRIAMAKRIEGEGRPVTGMTLHNWIRAWEADGLRGLVDGRRTKAVRDFEDLDPRFKTMVEQELGQFRGKLSSVSASENRRRIWARMAEEGIARSVVPQRRGDEYIAFMRKQIGRTPRAHKSALVRQRSGFGSSDLIHPSHVCMDVTRADVRVWDEDLKGPFSVEIITVLSVSTRVVLACRVVPRSATSVEAALAMYDAMRPFSMLVDGTQVDDWRWAGLPQSLELPARYSNMRHDLQGVHWIPSVKPTSVRTDHGSNFVSEHFLSVMREFGISCLPSRVGAPTDNAFIERWHETLQKAVQQVPGYKGRNTQQRGSGVDDEPLWTVRQLESLLHRYIALDYHRDLHEGLVLPGLERGRFSPLEFFDVVLEAAGSIEVAQHPDLIYQFLPTVWLTPNGAGVEYKNLSYDGPALRDFRRVPKGTFQKGTGRMPFHYDPRDLSRLWFRHPETDRIQEVRWRGAAHLDAPLTDRTLGRALQLIAKRGGNRALKRGTATLQIIDVLGDLASTITPESVVDKVRWEAAQRDHSDARDAAATFPGAVVVDEPWFDIETPWPDYSGV